MRRNLAILALLAACVIGCHTEDRQVPPAERTAKVASSESLATSASAPAATQEARRRVRVASMPELIDGIGSDRVIELAPGDYDLSKVANEHRDYVKLEKVHDGLQVVIRDVRNLKIVGTGGAPVSVTTPYAYANVLTFRKAIGIELVNLRLGHAPDPGYCVGGVLGLGETSDVLIDRCDLYGCGTEGITAEDARKLLVKDSTIRDCTYGILTLRGSRDVRFERTRMVNNECFTPITVDDCKDVAFVDCVITGNRTEHDPEISEPEPLFTVTSSSRVSVSGGEIRDNQTKGLATADSGITFTNVKGADGAIEKK